MSIMIGNEDHYIEIRGDSVVIVCNEFSRKEYVVTEEEKVCLKHCLRPSVKVTGKAPFMAVTAISSGLKSS